MNSHPRTLYESIFSNTESLHKYIWCVYCSVWSPAKIIASYSELFKEFACPVKLGALCLVWFLTNISTFLKKLFKKFVLSEGHFNWRPIQLISHATVPYWGWAKDFSHQLLDVPLIHVQPYFVMISLFFHICPTLK